MAATIEIQINDSVLSQSGFSKFTLPLDDNCSNTMLIWYNDNTIFCPFDKSDIDKTVKSFEDRLFSANGELKGVGHNTIKDLVTYFRNECNVLKEDKDSGFFKGGNGKENHSPPKKTVAQEALEIVDKNCPELFIDQFGSPYAAVNIGEHMETLNLKSSRFRNWLCKTFYYESSVKGNILSNDNLTNVLNILKAKAEFGGITRNLYLRVAKADFPQEPYTIYYDLTNKDWQIVTVTEDGWNVEYAPTPIFRRYNNQQPQAYPSKEYPSDIFDKFIQLINIKDQDNKLLLKCYIIALFYPYVPKPALMLHGEQGSAKTTAEDLIKMTADPSSIKTLTFPRDKSELIQQLMHNYVCYYDNESSITSWISDQLCRAVTGGGHSKRELYSNDDDIIYDFQRCVGFNGINLAATKADLIERGIILELLRIPKMDRQKIEVIWQEFEKLRPQLLGYIFDILTKVLKVKKNGGIEIKGYPRMADFAEIGEIISRCMGNEDNQFLKAYDRNIELQTEEAIESHAVGTTILKLMESNDYQCRWLWKGTTSELLADLDQIADDLKINKHAKSWPKAPNSLSRRIKEVKTNLREIGIIIDGYVQDQKTNIKGIVIRKISQVSQDRKMDKNRAQITSDITSDRSCDMSLDEYQISQDPNISQDQTPQNHAQNRGSCDTCDSCDIIRPSTGPAKTAIAENFQPLVSLDHFFNSSRSVPNHTLEQSPCYPIIGSKIISDDKNKHPEYYCRLHPDVETISLESMEWHCKTQDPGLHIEEIQKRLELKAQGKDWEI